MALVALPVLSPPRLSADPCISPFLKSSFLPATIIPSSSTSFSYRTTTTTTTGRKFPRPLTVTASSSKIVRFPPLDRNASKHSRLRFARKLKTLLLSKPRHFLPLRILSRCRPYLGLPPSRSLLSMVLRYPALFRILRSPSDLLSVALTPAAEDLAARESLARSHLTSALASKLQRLLMLSPRRSLLLSKLVHLAPDLGLPPNFRSHLCNSHPDRFRTVDTSYGRALQLVAWDDALAVPFPSFRPPLSCEDRRPIIDRPSRFKHLPLRRGLNLKRRHRDYLIRLREMPDVSPYAVTADRGEEQSRWLSPEEAEKRACAVVREVLGMTVEKRTLVDHLTHLRKDFGLPNRLRALLVRHPELFYVSVKGVRHSVFLMEAYDDKGKLLVEDELLEEKRRLMELVREGKKMRRERRKDVGYSDHADSVEEEEDDEEEEEGNEDDDFANLFESGIGEDWEEIRNWTSDGITEIEVEEFWVKKAASTGVVEGVGELEAW
ncbi:protein WHAT'S THIS FACTOR 1, chloroplastic-like [Zingiber officinale]|nr:protein WHAT'S THIS FACTOR 1, chloroplastic-like [Zingiber officinale]XP_042468527.1 protein WHAT'S THIS FACTOR 1, chloroplastic-like [Zingiber officinale]XP_042468529.1 protein WHAT'S THIS FACTOR 1, chloroplastic-like [Zingiber officinale]